MSNKGFPGFIITGCFSAFLLFAASPLCCQVSLSGQVLDRESNEPLGFATILLLNGADSALITGGLSDAEGHFVLETDQRGSMILQCTYVGFQRSFTQMLIGEANDTYSVGKVLLAREAEQLGEVVVEGQRATLSSGMDRRSFNLDDRPAGAGSSVLDVMRTLPGVNVDQEGKVVLRGSDKVMVLIDGKQSSLTGFGNQQGLSGIPAANIERIEIITNPSARYDATGMAGIINIVYRKQNDKGLNGELGFSYGLGQWFRRKEDLPTELGSYRLNPKYSPSISLNYGNDRTNFFLRGEVLRQKRLPNNEFNARTYEDGTRILSQVPENRTQTQYILQGGVDWQLSPRSTISLSGIYDYESHIDTAQVPYLNGENGQRRRYWHWSEDEVTGYMNYRANFVHRFPEAGHEITATAQYTRGWEDEKYFLNDSSAIRRSVDTTHLDATEHTTSLSLDYVLPLRMGRLEAGAKAQIRRIPITYLVGMGEQSIIYPGLGDWSKWGEDLYAAYLNFVMEKERFVLEAGLRLEQVDVFYEFSEENIYYSQNDAYGYLRLYPNIRFSYKMSDRHRMSAFYSRRVDRPGEPELRLFPKYDDPELLKVGNPYLRPQFTQNFELAYKYIWNQGSAFLAGYYKIIDDAFLRVYSTDDSDPDYSIVNRIYQNVGRGSQTGLEFLFEQEIGASGKLSVSLNGYLNQWDAYTGILLFPTERPFAIPDTEEFTLDAKVSTQWTLPWQLDLQVTFLYQAPKNIPQGHQYARSSLDLGVKKTFLENRLEASLSISDIFNRFGLRQEIDGEGFTVLYENLYETQILTAGLRYKF